MWPFARRWAIGYTASVGRLGDTRTLLVRTNRTDLRPYFRFKSAQNVVKAMNELTFQDRQYKVIDLRNHKVVE